MKPLVIGTQPKHSIVMSGLAAGMNEGDKYFGNAGWRISSEPTSKAY